MHPDQLKTLKRMAINVVSLLPEDRREAIFVLDYAARLVNDFIEATDCQEHPRGRLYSIKP